MRNITDIGPRTFIINRGLADGISLEQVVVDDGGAVVGRVVSVQTYDATILLVNDTSNLVIGRESGQNADPNAVGNVQGQVGGLLQMSYVAATETLSKGHGYRDRGHGQPGRRRAVALSPGSAHRDDHQRRHRPERGRSVGRDRNPPRIWTTSNGCS